MADLPGREDPAYEAAKERAAELAAVFAGHQVVTEAELATRGIHPVSIAHGSAETGHDADLIFEVVPRLARTCGPLAGTRGGNEHTTYLFTGPHRRGLRHRVHRRRGGDSAAVVAGHRDGLASVAVSGTTGRPQRRYLDPGDRLSGRQDPPRPCRVLTWWGPGGGPRNVLVRYGDGSQAVIPFPRRLRRAPASASLEEITGGRA